MPPMLPLATMSICTMKKAVTGIQERKLDHEGKAAREKLEFEPPLRILHLEDNSNDAELIRALLEAEGFNVAVSRVSTQEGFSALIDQGIFDLILSDFTLPSFDGKSALKLARQVSPKIP